MSDQDFIRDSLRELLPEAEPISIQFHSRSLFPLYRVELSDGRLLAAKAVKSPQMARTEADALQALKRAGAPVPRCYGHHTASSSRAAIILMDFLEPERGSGPDPDRGLVEDLVRLYWARCGTTAGTRTISSARCISRTACTMPSRTSGGKIESRRRFAARKKPGVALIAGLRRGWRRQLVVAWSNGN